MTQFVADVSPAADTRQDIARELEQRLKGHDWHYADDESDADRWQAGCMQRDSIISLMQQLPRPLAKAIWDRFSPGFEFPLQEQQKFEPPQKQTRPLTNEPTPEQPYAHIVAMMQTHDWHFDYSDDGNVWRVGKAQRDSIIAALSNIPMHDAVQLWQSHASPDASFPLADTIDAESDDHTATSTIPGERITGVLLDTPPVVSQVDVSTVLPGNATVPSQAIASTPRDPLRTFSAINAGILLFFGVAAANLVAFYFGVGWIVFCVMVVGAMIAARDVHTLCTSLVYWSFRMGVPIAAVLTFVCVLGAIADIATGGVLWRFSMLGCAVLGCLSFLGHVTAKTGAAVCSAAFPAESSKTTLIQTQT